MSFWNISQHLPLYISIKLEDLKFCFWKTEFFRPLRNNFNVKTRQTALTFKKKKKMNVLNLNSLTTSNHFSSIFILSRLMSQMILYQRAVFRVFPHPLKLARVSEFKSISIVKAKFLAILLLSYCNFSLDFLATFFSIITFFPCR